MLSTPGVKYQNTSAWAPWGEDSMIVVVSALSIDSNLVIWGKIPLGAPTADTVLFNQQGFLFRGFQSAEYELLNGKLAAIVDSDVVWVEWNDSAHSFDAPERIVSGNYESPTVQYNRLGCVQHLEQTDQLVSISPSGTQTVEISGTEINNLNTAKTWSGERYFGYFAWDSSGTSETYVKLASNRLWPFDWQIDQFGPPEFSGGCWEPDLFVTDIIGRTRMNGWYLLAFISAGPDTTIYANASGYGYGDLQPLTSSTNPKRNTTLTYSSFNHQSMGNTFFLWCLWEAQTANGWQIRGARLLDQVEVGTTPEPVTPHQFKLSAYPNPFNPAVTIQYQIPAGSDATLEIIDLQGKRVRIFDSAHILNQDHSIYWDGRGDQGKALPAGLYFAQLTTGQHGETLKLTLLK